MKCLLILNVPPPFGGGEIRGEAMAKYFESKHNYVVYRYNRIKASKLSQGRLTLRNISDGLRWLFQSIDQINEHRPDKIFLSIPKNTAAFLRILLLIEYASSMNIMIYGELSGARFQFLEKGIISSMIGLHYLRNFHSIRFLGKKIQEYYDSIGIRNSIVIDNGVLAPPLPLNKPDLASARPLKLLYVGALNRSKGVAELVKAVEKLIESEHDVVCTLVGEWGDQSLKDDIDHKCATNQKLKEHLRFTGLITGHDKWNEYSDASILVHPTTWDGQPLTILEAMAMGLCIISTNIGAIPDTVEEGYNGKVLETNDPNAVAEAVAWYYNNPDELASVMLRNRGKYEERFSQDKYLINIQKWLEDSSNSLTE